MGASIYWQPVNGKALRVGARSAFLEALDVCNEQKIFAGGDVGFLQGMAAVSPDFREACKELVEAIVQHERVRVWAEY